MPLRALSNPPASRPAVSNALDRFHLVTSYELAREVIRAPDQYVSGVSPMALSDDGIPQEIIDIYEKKAGCRWPPARHQTRRSTHGSEVF
ncbi:MAG: hypothetical protein CM15mP103_05820 [Gammaproteobacteria bacterium]|nr:MAG: hypothetical protein CM15mP103_05820 [Gammaproteobacteria bacterium]